MDQLLDEAVDEATSGSPRRWALLLLMLVVGGIVAVWLSKRARYRSDLDAAVAAPPAERWRPSRRPPAPMVQQQPPEPARPGAARPGPLRGRPAAAG